MYQCLPAPRNELNVKYFKLDIINILPRTPAVLVMAGDFNYVQSDSDCTGHR